LLTGVNFVYYDLKSSILFKVDVLLIKGSYTYQKPKADISKI